MMTVTTIRVGLSGIGTLHEFCHFTTLNSKCFLYYIGLGLRLTRGRAKNAQSMYVFSVLWASIQTFEYIGFRAFTSTNHHVLWLPQAHKDAPSLLLPEANFNEPGHGMLVCMPAVGRRRILYVVDFPPSAQELLPDPRMYMRDETRSCQGLLRMACNDP